MAEAPSIIRSHRGRGIGGGDTRGGWPHSRNKHWAAEQGGSHSGSSTPAPSDVERWERGGFRRGRGRGRGPRMFPNATLARSFASKEDGTDGMDSQGEESEDHVDHEMEEEPDLDDEKEREAYYLELVKAREVERKKAIAEGKMDDPLIPKRLEDAITMVGTCMDMCPRFERYRREREFNLFQWETIPGTKRVDHRRAVKAYERAAGDKTLPSDLRPPKVLKRTLDYLFHELLPQNGFSQTFNFIRDRSRAVRNDFTMQHETGSLAIECHDRCARFHILALHFERDTSGFSIAMEEQQLMNTLQSLKEFYEDQRGRYESPTELEMRVYHRLIHIRDQKERHEDIPPHITEHPVFKLTTKFRLHIQKKSAPITKTSPLIVDAEGMEIFGELAAVLREQGSVVMIYLVACILERLFGKDTIDNIEVIRGDLGIPDVIDGISDYTNVSVTNGSSETSERAMDEDHAPIPTVSSVTPIKPSATEWLSASFGPKPSPSAIFGRQNGQAPFQEPNPPPQPPQSAFANLASVPNAFGSASTFGASPFGQTAPKSVFGGTPMATSSVFGAPSTSIIAPPSSSSLPNTSQSASASPLDATTSPQTVVNASVSTGDNLSRTSPVAYINAQPTSTSSVMISPTLKATAPVFVPSSGPPLSSLAKDAVNSQAFSTDSKVSETSQVNGITSSSTQTPSPPLAPDSPTTANEISSPLISKEQSQWSTKPSTDPPALHKIMTDVASKNSGLNLADPIRTPIDHPPPLSKLQPISLPSTPTTAFNSPQISKPLLAFPKALMQSSFTSSSELSPLPLSSSPSFTKLPFSRSNLSVADVTTSPTQITQPLGRRLPIDSTEIIQLKDSSSINGKAKQSSASLDAQAIEFSRKGLIVKECFERWQRRTTANASWAEACQRSDAYSEQVRRQRVVSESTSAKKRRVSSNASIQSPQKKRARRRVSTQYQPPRTDEELAQRFKENREEHERRWAPGSFLRTLRTHVRGKAGGFPSDWGAWLVANPDNDGTAIWLERKFDVPASGRWHSGTIFTIPLSSGASYISPGIIIFECTPLDGVTDELEKKYYVLDDCARLRDIVSALPARRYYVPSLLIISWSEEKQNAASSEFRDMVAKFLREEVIESQYVFSVTTATIDIDLKFEEALNSMNFDLEGKLVRRLNPIEILKLFEPSWREFVKHWMDTCFADDFVDWSIYGQIMKASLHLLNILALLVSQLSDNACNLDTLPSMNVDTFTDSDSLYDTSISWLEAGSQHATNDAVRRDLESYRSLGREFPAETFLNQQHELILSGQTGTSSFFVQKKDIESAKEEFASAVASSSEELQKFCSAKTRRSKRRSFGDGESDVLSSPSGAKRMRLSVSNTSAQGFELSPFSSPPESNHAQSMSPPSTIQDDSSHVTVAMLRELTKNVRKNYGTVS